MNQPLISVIIPIYNMELYLARCLDSILNNTYKNLEIICIDDGSSDNSLEILQQYSKKDSRFVIISKKNGGVSSARNAGLDRMTGEYVTFIDSDDFVHPQYFEVLLTSQQLTGTDICVGSHIKTTEIAIPVDFPHFTLSLGDVRTYTYTQIGHVPQICADVCSRIIPCTIIGETRFPIDYSYGEDSLFLLSLCEGKEAIRFGVTQFPIYYYYQGRSDSLVRSGRDKGVVRYITTLAAKASKTELEPIYMEPAFGRGLYFRYYYTYIQKNVQINKELGKVLRPKIGQLLTSRNIPMKYKIFWTLFVLSPGLDRLHRIYRDPSLKRYEQIQRAALAARQTEDTGRPGERKN